MSDSSALEEVTSVQGGFFTARQALDAGYSYPDQYYHLNRGNWIREGRGVYRLRFYPLPERSDLIRLTLLSRNKAGEPQAIVSHDSALVVHQLSDANPVRAQLTVPPGFRTRMPDGVTLHKGKVPDSDREQREGFVVTTPLRTIIDIAENPASWPYLADAVYDALQKGLVRPTQLLKAEVNAKTKQWLFAALEAAEERDQRRAGV